VLAFELLDIGSFLCLFTLMSNGLVNGASPRNFYRIAASCGSAAFKDFGPNQVGGQHVHPPVLGQSSA